MKLADARDQFRSRFAPGRCEGQQRCSPAIEIGSVNRCPGLSLPRAEIESPTAGDRRTTVPTSDRAIASARPRHLTAGLVHTRLAP